MLPWDQKQIFWAFGKGNPGLRVVGVGGGGVVRCARLLPPFTPPLLSALPSLYDRKTFSWNYYTVSETTLGEFQILTKIKTSNVNFAWKYCIVNV